MTTKEFDTTQKAVARALALIKVNEDALIATVAPEYIQQTIRDLQDSHDLLFHAFYQSKKGDVCNNRSKRGCTH